VKFPAWAYDNPNFTSFVFSYQLVLASGEPFPSGITHVTSSAGILSITVDPARMQPGTYSVEITPTLD